MDVQNHAMHMATPSSEQRDTEATLAVAGLYHAWLTGLVLGLVAHKGSEIAREFVFRLFRTQHLARFLPGLDKLGLTHLPHAVAAAKYHYLSNQLGGVKVEYFEESARKAWIRYPPPRWIWAGTAICAIPPEVNHAMLWGWHAHNGVSLQNPRLGFVCTATTVDGGAGLEGYYYEYDRELEPHERLRFAPEESCPPIDRAALPQLDSERWPLLRQSRAYLNYAMEYIRNGLPLLIALLGEEAALEFGDRCGRQVGMQCYDDIAARLQCNGDDAASFQRLLHALLAASGDELIANGTRLERLQSRLFAADTPLTALWRAPLDGLLAVHNRFLLLEIDADVFTLVERFTHSAARGDNE